jgi:hypothetical protein
LQHAAQHTELIQKGQLDLERERERKKENELLEAQAKIVYCGGGGQSETQAKLLRIIMTDLGNILKYLKSK